MENQTEEKVESQSEERGFGFGDFVHAVSSAATTVGVAVVGIVKKVPGVATDAANADAQATTDAANKVGSVAGGAAEAAAGGIVSAVNAIAYGVVNTANTVSNGVVGAANTVSDATVTAWKAASKTANTVGSVLEATGLTMGQGMIDGANIVAKYGEIGAIQTYKGLVAAGKYVHEHACDIALVVRWRVFLSPWPLMVKRK